jgi:hypothetical protein
MREGWAQEGARRWHFYRNGMPICYQRLQYVREGWLIGGPFHTGDEMNPKWAHQACKDCLFFAEEDELPPAFRGVRARQLGPENYEDERQFKKRRLAARVDDEIEALVRRRSERR